LLKRDRWRKAVSAINALAIVECIQKETHSPIVITNRATERVLTVEELMAGRQKPHSFRLVDPAIQKAVPRALAISVPGRTKNA
jgi:hypothetical protein